MHFIFCTFSPTIPLSPTQENESSCLSWKVWVHDLWDLVIVLFQWEVIWFPALLRLDYSLWWTVGSWGWDRRGPFSLKPHGKMFQPSQETLIIELNIPTHVMSWKRSWKQPLCILLFNQHLNMSEAWRGCSHPWELKLAMPSTTQTSCQDSLLRADALWQENINVSWRRSKIKVVKCEVFPSSLLLRLSLDFLG